MLSNFSFNHPALLSVCVDAGVERSLSTACAAAQQSSSLRIVCPCVALSIAISAIS